MSQIYKRELCSVSAIKEILYPEGFHFSKSMGQNFLVNPRIPDRIADTLPDGEYGVFEVGPGLGALTDRLSLRAKKLVAVELDDRLISHLESYFSDREVVIVRGDILMVNINELCAELPPRRAAYANLPYYITSPAISVLLESHTFEYITLMVQKEVAARICANPATPDYSAFTVYCNYFSIPETLFQVTSGNFYPAPKVDSAVIRLECRKVPPVEVPSEKKFFDVVRAAFSARRKTLRNNLSPLFGGKEAAGETLLSVGIAPERRGETLSCEEFAAIARKLG